MKLEMRAEMQFLQRMALELKTTMKIHRGLVTQIMGTVEEGVREVMKDSDGDLAKRCRRQPLWEAELRRLVVVHFISSHSNELHALLGRNLDVFEHTEEVDTLVEAYGPSIDRVLCGKGFPQKEVEKPDKAPGAEERAKARTEAEALAAILTGLHSREMMSLHFEALQTTKAAKLTRIRERHIPALRKLYRPYKMNENSIVKICNDEIPDETFLGDFDEHEGPVLGELLPRTERLRKRKTVQGRRKEETIHGWLLHSPIDEEDAFAAFLETVSPYDPAKDRVYFDRKMKEIEEMHYSDPTEKAFLERYYLRKGADVDESDDVTEIFLMVQRYAGGMWKTMEKTMQPDTDLRPNCQTTTYAMGEVQMIVDDEPVSGIDAQNWKSIVSLLEAGLKLMKAWSENPDKKKRFRLQLKRALESKVSIADVWPKWFQFRGPRKRIGRIAATKAP